MSGSVREKTRELLAKSDDFWSERLRALCTCADCPTYTECMREKEDALFCITGKSPACMFERKTCICPSCPILIKYQFEKKYFCIGGSEKEQR